MCGGFIGKVFDTVTDDILGFDPGGGGIYDVARDVLGDDIADDILGLDPGGGGIVPLVNTAADAVVKYLALQGITSGIDSLSNLASATDASTLTGAADYATVAQDAAAMADVSKDVAMIQQNLIAAGVDPIMAAEAANQAVLGATATDIAGSLASAFPYDKVYVSSGLLEGGATMDPFAKEIGGDITAVAGKSPISLQQASNALKLVGGLGKQAAVTPLLQPAQQQQTQPGVVDYSNYLSLLASQMPQRRTSLI